MTNPLWRLAFSRSCNRRIAHIRAVLARHGFERAHAGFLSKSLAKRNRDDDRLDRLVKLGTETSHSLAVHFVGADFRCNGIVVGIGGEVLGKHPALMMHLAKTLWLQPEVSGPAARTSRFPARQLLRARSGSSCRTSSADMIA